MAIDPDLLASRVLGEEPLVDQDLPEPPPAPFDYREHYWLATPYYAEEIAEEIAERFTRHLDEWDATGVGRTIWTAYRAFHNISQGGDDPLVQLMAEGEQGELLALAIPHYRSLVRHQIALFTRDRPAWDPQARTSDADAARQVPLASNLLDFVASSGDIDQLLATQAELMMVAGAGFFVTGWNATVGLEGRGWFTSQVLAPWELTHEHVRTYSDAQWWIFRTFESRWDWVAHFAETDPDKAEALSKIDTKATFERSFTVYSQEMASEDSDRIAVLNLIAKPSKACPGGRYAKVTGDSIVLQDGPHPFGEDVPISRMCASEFLGTAVPYCDSWGVLAAADAFNAILSAIMSRIDVGAVPNLFKSEGSELEASELPGQMAVWTLPPGGEKPGAVDLLHIPNELPAVLSLLGSQMEQTVGINSVTRGQPQENISSGSMAALLQSMAIEYNSNLERAWALNLERIGTHHLRIFQRMASDDMAISVMGADHRWTVQRFKGEDVGGILRVSVKTASALAKTTAGRADIADKLLERGLITPQEYLRVIQTGQLEQTFFGPVGELSTIKSRAERLLRGEPTPAMIWDSHQLCVRELRGLLNTEARDRPELAQVIMQAIQEHFDLWAKLSRESPDMLAAIGCPPLPQAAQVGQQAMMMQQQGMQGAPPMPPGAPQPGPRQQPQPNTEDNKGRPGPNAAAPGRQPGASPRMPSQPTPAKNPLDGKPVVQ